MVRPNTEGNGWNHAATVEEESKHHREHQEGVLHDPEEVRFDSSSSEHSACPRRGRSMSVASTQPSVETVVSKAKRAASTLWTLLHAQHCTLADACTHPGCKEAKLLHLHFKMCPAGIAFGCPSNYRGCDQGRKLLAHYKRCKSIRAKQVGQTGMRRDAAQQHVCLVCNLVARQARSVLERPKPAAATTHGGCHNPSPSPAASATSAATVRKTGSRRIISSFMLDSSNRVVQIPANAVLMSSPKMMPPPPPRRLPTSEPLKGNDDPLRSPHSFPPPMGRSSLVSQVSCSPEQEVVMKETKTVSFHGAGRGRAYSHSEGYTSSPPSSCFQRPRSQSLGGALTAGSLSHKNCDTIAEEGESGEFAEVWHNPAA